MNGMELSWTPIVEKETLGDGSETYVAFHPEIVGIRAQESTEESARELYSENLNAYFEHLDALRMPRPQPTHIVYEPFEIHGSFRLSITETYATTEILHEAAA